MTVPLPGLGLGRHTLAILVQLPATVASSDLQGCLPAGHKEEGFDLGPGGVREVGGSLNRCTKACDPGRGLRSAVTPPQILEARTQSWGEGAREAQVRVGIQEVGSGVPGRIS